MAEQIRILGMKKIEKALKKKLAEVEESLEPMTHAAAEVVREAASDKAPERTGDLSEHIVQETTEKTDETVTVAVGPDETVAWYGHLVEFGTNAHRVTHDRARGLRMDEDAFAAGADHPGAAAKPYMRPALDEEADAAVEAGGKVLKKKLKL